MEKKPKNYYKIKKESRSIIISKYITADDKEFTNEEEAIIHQEYLGGKRKKCWSCYGSGQNPYYDGKVDKELKCIMCNGVGYPLK